MIEPTATLYINLSSSRCGACGKSTLPHDKRHETPSGWDQAPGCGALFAAVSSDYEGPGLAARIRDMRPDLPFVNYWETEGEIAEDES